MIKLKKILICGGEHSVYAKLYEGADGYILELSSKKNYQDKELKMINNFDNFDIGNNPFKNVGSTPWYNERNNIVQVKIVDEIAPLSTAYLFAYLWKLKNIENIENLDTSYVTNMTYMFNNCQNLETIDLSRFDTSGVTDMSSMFAVCGVKILDVSSFDTGNVINMNRMFAACKNLEEIIGLNSFNTMNVTDMIAMFACNSVNEGKLTSLDLTSFNTSNVKDMSSMFARNSTLTTIYANKEMWKLAPTIKDIFKDCGTSEVTFI